MRRKLLNLPRQAPAADRRSDAAVWKSHGLRLLIATPLLYVTVVALIFHSGWAAKALVALALGMAIASPFHGLLFAAAVAPLGVLGATLIHDEAFRISEAVVVAFLAGWLLRERFHERLSIESTLGLPGCSRSSSSHRWQRWRGSSGPFLASLPRSCGSSGTRIS